jgi:hypothetical protein
MTASPCTLTLTKRHRAGLRYSLQCSTRHGAGGQAHNTMPVSDFGRESNHAATQRCQIDRNALARRKIDKPEL